MGGVPIVIVCVFLTGTDSLLLVHLPNGPTAHFKLTSFKRGRDIRASCTEKGTLTT